MKESLSRVIYFLERLYNAMSEDEEPAYPEAYGKNPPDKHDIDVAVLYMLYYLGTEDEPEHINLDELGME